MRILLVCCRRTALVAAGVFLAPGPALAESTLEPLKQAGSVFGIVALLVFIATYAFVVLEEWAWAIALGYAASVWLHLAINARYFT